MNPLYNAGIALFNAGVSAASWRSHKIREMVRGRRRTLSTLAATREAKAPGGFDVWIHAASLGEFEQGRPLIERLRRERPEMKILLTFFSPSGYRVRHDFPLVDAVEYLPSDSPGDVRRFLDAARPHCAIFIKYEFWGNYLEQLSRRGIPSYIISSIFRPGQRFFRTGGGMFRRMLRDFTHIYVQDEPSRRLLAGIGVDRVTVAGDTRFDRVTDIQRAARRVPSVEDFCRRSPFVFIAGSSWEADEDLYLPWLTSQRDVCAIIAPHQFDEVRLRRLVRRAGAGTHLLSEIKALGSVPADCRVIVVDSFGLLSTLYRHASAAYIGGGFGAGIHNINEAAVYGIPVMFGPRHQKFKEASDLIECGGAFETPDRASFVATVERLRGDAAFRESSGRAAGEYIRRNLGATDIIFADIFGKKQ